MRNVHVAFVALALVACAGGPDPEAAPSTYAASLAAADASAVVALVNYPGTTAEVLDDAVGLDARAARGIVLQRDGVDRLCPSSDDAPFATVQEIDAVPYVGDAAFRALYAYAAAHPAPRGETVEGVDFSGWQSEAVVWGVNHATSAELDALLDARAASALIAARPFATVTAMGPVSYVGATALGHLRSGAIGWWSAMHASAPVLAGTFDSVAFDEAAATTALDIANHATRDQMVANGVPGNGASVIVGNRPYTTLAAVAAVSGVGTSTMSGLRAYAQSGAWGAPPPACTNGFDAAARPHLADLLFLSESDRPIEIVSYAGAGATAPTAASVLALVSEEAGSTVEQRDVANYYVAFEPSSGMADPAAAAALEAAVSANLTDVIYVAVSLPRTDPYHAEVRVYLLGRDGCGNLVGLKSIAVET
ncbi:MAG TPA: nuclease A inhibitor family protein [Polyangiaceae bacterium]|nr:nuclease A inhibitor family protein [Polyangiaceae bacterium]